MMRRFTSGPKPRSRVLAVGLAQVAAGLHAQPVAHAVEAREVAGGLRGGHDVVGRDGVPGVGEGDVDDPRARGLEGLRAPRGTRPSTRGSTPFSRNAPGHADAHALRAAGRARRRNRAPAIVGAGGVARRRGRTAREDSSAASSTVRGEGADLVERRREGHEAVAAHAAVGRLQADDAAQRGGLADGAAGVGAERDAAPCRRRPPPPSRPTIRPAPARGPRGCAWACRRCSRWTSPSRTRPCWSCRARSRPPPPGASTAVAVKAGGSPRGCASRRWWARPRCRAGP